MTSRSYFDQLNPRVRCAFGNVYSRAGGEVVIAPGDTLGYFLQLEEGRWASKYIRFMDSWIINFLQSEAEQSIFEAWWSIHRHIDGRGDEIGDVWC